MAVCLSVCLPGGPGRRRWWASRRKARLGPTRHEGRWLDARVCLGAPGESLHPGEGTSGKGRVSAHDLSLERRGRWAWTPPPLAQAQPQQWGPWGWPHVTGGSPPPPRGSTSVCCWWRLKAGTRAGPGGGWPGARPLVAVCLPRACLRGHSGHMGRGEGPVFGSAQRGHRGRPGARGPAAGSLARRGGLTLVLDSLPAALALSLFC